MRQRSQILGLVALAAVLVAVLCAVWAAAGHDWNPPAGTRPAAGAPPVEEVARASAESGVDSPAESDESVERRRLKSPEPAESPAPQRAVLAELRGRVELPDGAPAVAARVQIGTMLRRTGEDGDFEFPRREVASAERLVAMQEGYQPALVDNLAATIALLGEEPLIVRLPGRALSIEGVLVDAAGNPCAGWDIELWHGTAVDDGAFPPLRAEDYAAGAQQLELPGAVGPRSRVQNPNWQRTDEHGAFAVRGLRGGQQYRLRAWDARTLQQATSRPILAGTAGYVFTVPALPRRPVVSGTVSSTWGTPLAGVRVRLSMRVHQTVGQTSYQTGQTTHTAADGSFEFHGVPRTDLLLRFDGSDVEGLYRDLPAAEPGVGLAIALAAKCRMRVESVGAVACDAIRVLDRDLAPVRLTRAVRPGFTTSSTHVALKNGASPELSLIDSGCWLVLERGSKEVERRPLRLLPGIVNVVRD